MSAHTPGPWRWELNEKSKELQLCGGVPTFDLTVIDFARWGMDSAVARFRADVARLNLMHHAKDFAAVVVGREHHAEWFKTLNHPDANLIAAAPELLEMLEEIIGSAHPHPTEHPSMHRAWTKAQALVARTRGVR